MKKLVCVCTSFIVLAILACNSEDDSVDCSEASITLGETFEAYEQIPSTDNCAEYKEAIEVFLINTCDNEDQVLLSFYEEELERLGDCTIAGMICLFCTNAEETIQVCQGENGNAFIGERDTEITFERYLELSNCE